MAKKTKSKKVHEYSGKIEMAVQQRQELIGITRNLYEMIGHNRNEQELIGILQ